MKSRVAAQKVPKLGFSKLRDLMIGILVSDWADFRYSGVFGHGEFENMSKSENTYLQNIEISKSDIYL
jgi:hypothetical protein